MVLDGILFGHKTIKKLVEFQEQIVQAVGKEKMEPELAQVDEELECRARDLATERIIEARVGQLNVACGGVLTSSSTRSPLGTPKR